MAEKSPSEDTNKKSKEKRSKKKSNSKKSKEETQQNKADEDDEPFERDLSKLLDTDDNLSPEELKQREIKQMLEEGWVMGPTGMVGPPRRPPPIPPKSTSIPGIYAKTEYDTSHMWNADLQDNEGENEGEKDAEIDLSGTKVAEKYSISPGELGSGGSSVVKSVQDKSTKHDYALKILNPTVNHLPTNTWKNTVKVWEACNGHPRIVKLHEHFTEGDSIYLVLEKLYGPATKVLSANDLKWTQKDACRIVTQILEAVQHVHSKGITHGDVTPSNILSVDDKVSEVKLGGFAKAVESESDQDLFCDACFKAPEVLERKKHGQSVDMWSIGCLAYLFLTGKLPFYDKNMMRLTLNIKKGTYSITEVGSELAQSFVQSLLNIDPTKRPNATDALKHEWIKSGGSDETIPNFHATIKTTVQN